MKKAILTSLIAASAIFAASDDQIVNFYGGMVGDGVKISVTERKQIAEDIEAVVVKLSNGENSQNEIVFSKGDLLFPDVINLKEQKSYLSEIKKDLVAKGISNVYKGEDKSNIITIGNDKNKPTIVMFSDPECPYCRAELERIETTLKGSNVQIVLTPVHDKSSLQKSFLAYKEIKTAKSDSEKIKILRKYFDENYTVEGGAISDAEAQKIDDLRKKYFAAGVRSVPTVVNLSDLQK